MAQVLELGSSRAWIWTRFVWFHSLSSIASDLYTWHLDSLFQLKSCPHVDPDPLLFIGECGSPSLWFIKDFHIFLHVTLKTGLEIGIIPGLQMRKQKLIKLNILLQIPQLFSNGTGKLWIRTGFFCVYWMTPVVFDPIWCLPNDLSDVDITEFFWNTVEILTFKKSIA